MRASGYATAALLTVAVGCGAPAPVGDGPQSLPAVSADDPAPSGPLRVGGLLPLTGDIAELGPDTRAAAERAVHDINEAGGVLEQPVELMIADSGEGSDIERMVAAAGDLSDGAVSVVVGPLGSSTASREAAATLAERGVLVVSPSARGEGFANDPLVVRLGTPDALQGHVLAREVIDAGATTAALVARLDDYGHSIAEVVRRELDAAGVEIVFRDDYGQELQSWGWVIEQVVDARADAVILVSFDEALRLVEGLVDQGVEADAVWSADGLADGPDLPATLAGLRGVRLAGQDLGRVGEVLDVTEEEGPYAFLAGATYDAVVLAALATAAAGTTDAAAVAAHLPGLTRPGGEQCRDVSRCLALIGDGVAVSYDGLLGMARLADRGEPTGATYELWQAQPDGTRVSTGARHVDEG